MAKGGAKGVKSIDYPIVGIGASAGGITALQTLFESLPPQPNVALVVIQHLPPGHSSGLVSLIRRWAPIPVHVAADGIRPEINCVYIPSPDHILTIEDGVFCTRQIKDSSHRPGIDTIDAFLESLATDQGRRGIAIVLSGTGMDGASGAVRIGQAGGIVLVQDPLTALHDGMPNAVISRGIANYVLPISSIAQQLAACAAPSYVRPDSSIIATSDISQTLDRIAEFVRKQIGFDLSGYKPAPLLWRIQQRMNIRKVPLFPHYLALLEDDGSELEELVRGIPIHVTEFFRDSEAWDVLRQDALEPLFSEAHSGRPIRGWTPACSSGEEAYSLAILLSECAENDPARQDFQVFATDASPEILARASRGVFSGNSVNSLSEERKTRFFYLADGAFRIKRALREKMVFAPQDLLADPPFTALDIITCRNLLIYLEPHAVKRVVFLLHSALRMGGYLFLGRGEALSARQKGFEPVSTQWNIYRKIGPISNLKIRFPSRPKASPSTAVPAVAHRTAVEHFDLPSVLIDDQFHILRVYGETDKMLRQPEGQPTHNLLELVESTVAGHLRAGTSKALAGGHPVTVYGLRDRETGELTTSMRLTPLQTSDDCGSARLLVSFLHQLPGSARVKVTEGSRGSYDVPGLQEWTEVVRISQEELEASREELQALNEELKASNDQLNISNEELSQVNVQLQGKIAELEMQSRVLSSGAVMTLFLDDELNVRWFTPAVSALFPLLPGDAGRRITDLVPKIHDKTFLTDIDKVMRFRELREAEVHHADGRWFLRAIRPYWFGAESLSGVAVTFADISERKQHERQQEFLLKLSDALRSTADPVAVEEVVTRAAMGYFAVDRCYYAAIEDGHVIIGSDAVRGDLPSIAGTYSLANFALFKKVIDEGRPFVVHDANTTEILDEALRKICLSLEVISFINVPVVKNGKTIGILCLVQSAPRNWTKTEVELAMETAERAWAAITRARAEEALRANEEKYRTLIESIDEGFCIIEVLFDKCEKPVDYLFLEVSTSFQKQTGIENAVGKRMREIKPKHEEHWFEIYGRVALTGESVRFRNCAAELHRWYDVFAFRVGEPHRHHVAILFNDITERERAEAALREAEAEKARNDELERFNKLTVGRELRMIELKKEINKLHRQRGQSAPYALTFEENDKSD